MTYIIENANILKDQRITKASLLIDKGKILSIKSDFKRYRYIKMNADPFIMTPVPILLLKEFPSQMSFRELKEFFKDEFIFKGCTAFMTLATVKQERSLSKEIKDLKLKLLNSPIDYIICVRISVQLLTQSLLRKCMREKVPAIFVEINNVDELEELPWGWLREAMFPYNSPLIPIFVNDNAEERKRAKIGWGRTTEEEKIPSIKDELSEDEPIPSSVLAKIGIFPMKSTIQQGCELSYNLYLKSREIRNIEESKLFHYHRHMLITTVHKGEVIRAQDYVNYRPGYGEHVKINIPSFFKLEN